MPGFPSFSQVTDNVDAAEAADVNAIYDAIDDIVTATPFAGYANTETLAATKTLVDSDFPIQFLDPDGANRDIELPAEGSDNHAFFIMNTAAAPFNLVVKDDSPATIVTIGQNQSALLISDGTTWIGAVFIPSAGLGNIVEDTTPQLGGDLDLNGKNIDFPTTADVDDCLDEDNMASDSPTALSTQQSIKAYADTKLADVVDDGSPQLGGDLDLNGSVFTNTPATEITDELGTLTHTAPGTPDFAIQDLGTAGGLWGFVDHDEGNSVLAIIANNQARINDLEDKLVQLGLIPDAD